MQDSLEETFSFLEELSVDTAVSLPLDSDELGEQDPNSLSEALDNDIGDRSETPEQWMARAPPKRRQRKNKNKARDERRFLLIQLREEVQRLEFTLEQLKSIRNRQINESGSGQCCTTTPETNGVPAVWQEICVRQLRRRMEAERKNIQLKLQCEKEKELVKAIAKVLYKRKTPKTQGPDAQKHTRRTDIPPGYIERMAAFIFEELSVGVAELCHQVDELCLQMEDALEICRSFPAVQRPLLRDSVKGREERMLDTRVLPFSIQDAGDAWWGNWHLHRGRSIQETSEDVVVERFGLDMSDFNANTSVASYGQQILRRVVADQRIEFVWNAYMEPFVFENKHVSGLYFLEQCLVHIAPNQEKSANREEECSTNMSTSYVITPCVLDSKLHNDPKTGALIDFFVGSLFSVIKARCEMVENLLFDQALEKLN
ncbi:unnamed protein product [Phytophthora fragariaefolia]|uniref:Unnamed protein product n=1 Tax=Phytophthora fragariaefolia TaxID=1490495 RepID=A0A9W7D5X4_9STRA|nr:unnamed protein product [Phytophthora fragariaefolia]